LSGIRWLPNQRTRPPEPPFMQWCCWLSTIPSESRETLVQAHQPRREAQPDNPSNSRRPERRSEALANGRRLRIHQEYTTNGRVRPGVIPRKGHGRVKQKSREDCIYFLRCVSSFLPDKRWLTVFPHMLPLASKGKKYLSSTIPMGGRRARTKDNGVNKHRLKTEVPFIPDWTTTPLSAGSVIVIVGATTSPSKMTSATRARCP